MKRKIGIIIAAILAIGGIAVSGLVSEDVQAATGYTGSIFCKSQSSIAGNNAKACARVFMVLHTDLVPHCTSNESSCKSEIKSHISAGNGIQDQDGRTYAMNQSADNIYASMVAGPSDYDPCADVISYGQASCQSSHKGIYENKVGMDYTPYYYTPAGASLYDSAEAARTHSSTPGSGDDDDDDDDDDTPKATGSSDDTDVDNGDCTSILPSSWCDKYGTDKKGSGMTNMIKFVVSVMTGAVVVAGTIGIIICGVMMMTARDNEAQMTTARRRLIEIVIGVIAWVLISVLVNLFIPQSETTTDNVVGVNTVLNKEKDA